MKEWNKKRKAMCHYDNLAQVYDAQYSEEQNAKIEAALNNTKLSQNEHVLDVGCGTGLLFQHVAKSAKLVVGIDVASKILQEARKRTEQLPNTAVIRADADYTPFQNQTFDQSFCHNPPSKHAEPRQNPRRNKKSQQTSIHNRRNRTEKEVHPRTFHKTPQQSRTENFHTENKSATKRHLAVCKK